MIIVVYRGGYEKKSYFYSEFIFYSGVLVGATFVIFTYLLTILLYSFSKATENKSWFAAFGLMTGIAALFRASILLFVPFALIYAIIISQNKKKALINSACRSEEHTSELQSH